MGDELVTLIRCDGEHYTTVLYGSASWFEKTGIRPSDSGFVSENSVRVRIPNWAILLAGGGLPEVGDHILRGTLPAGCTIQSPADLAALGARRILAVGDDRRGRMPHVAVSAV